MVPYRRTAPLNIKEEAPVNSEAAADLLIGGGGYSRMALRSQAQVVDFLSDSDHRLGVGRR
jgi:hypothetical protein